MTLIGLHGLAGTGKDTIAEYLEEMYGFDRVAFARPLKLAVLAGFNLTMDIFEHRDLKEKEIEWIGKSPRQLAQLMGDAFREKFGDDILIKIAKRRLEEWREEIAVQTFHPYAGVVVTDIRGEDEAAWVRSEGGVVWHINRSSAQAVAAHRTEAGIVVANGDRMIMNNGTIAELYEYVDSLMGQKV